MGAFAYSHEEGTYSFKHYTDDIDPDVKQDRLDYLMRIQEGISAEVNGSKIGKEFKVMIDREEEDSMSAVRNSIHRRSIRRFLFLKRSR